MSIPKTNRSKELIFQLKTSCPKHSKMGSVFICTFPSCSQIQLCSICYQQHSQIHPQAYIQHQNQWIKQISSDIDQLSTFTKDINIGPIKAKIQKNLTLSSSKSSSNQYICSYKSIKQKEDLPALVQKLMKCITDQRNNFTQKFNEKINRINSQNYSKVAKNQALLNYFLELQNSKCLQWIFFIINQKGWKKMKKKLINLNQLAINCKQYITISNQLIKDLQKINNKLQKHEKLNNQLPFLDNIQKLILWKQNLIKKQINQSPRKEKIISNNNYNYNTNNNNCNEIKLFKAPPKQIIRVNQQQKLQFRGQPNESPKRKRSKTIFGQKIKQT